MLSNIIVASALVGFATAAPAISGNDFTSSQISKREPIGPLGIAIASGVVGGGVGPILTRAFNDLFGVQKKRNAALDVANLTWDEARKAFISKSVEDIYEADRNSDRDAAVCAGIGYTVGDPSKTVDSTSVKFESNGQVQEYDCFILEGPTNFTVPAYASDAQVAVKVGANGSFQNGTLILN